MSWTGTRTEFIDQFGPYVKKITRGSGILPGTLITQAILESSGKYNGKWVVGGSGLSRKANNFFGIKAGSSWKGATYEVKTDEYINGKWITITDKFRKYPSPKESLKDYINFLSQNTRYAQVLRAKTVEDQFRALKAAGYATAPSYVQTLIDVYRPLKPQIDKIPEYKPTTIVAGVISLAAFIILFNQILKDEI